MRSSHIKYYLLSSLFLPITVFGAWTAPPYELSWMEKLDLFSQGKYSFATGKIWYEPYTPPSPNAYHYQKPDFQYAVNALKQGATENPATMKATGLNEVQTQGLSLFIKKAIDNPELLANDSSATREAHSRAIRNDVQLLKARDAARGSVRSGTVVQTKTTPQLRINMPNPNAARARGTLYALVPYMVNDLITVNIFDLEDEIRKKRNEIKEISPITDKEKWMQLHDELADLEGEYAARFADAKKKYGEDKINENRMIRNRVMPEFN